ncbi:MAG: dephospho-CoA kinase [Clostridia bacterium]|nr:dephospho-CoA kinase [Clostridia bacterium]
MKVAVTGGIGSGKTALCNFIEKEGTTVFSCDKIYGEMLESDEDFRNRILTAFPAAKAEDGSVDRKALSAIVFEDKRKRAVLDGITHPMIMKELMRRMDNVIISFAEVPLLFEAGYEKSFDTVIVLMRDEEERIRAVMDRSGLTYNEAKARVRAQANYEKLALAKYYVVYNNGTMDDLYNKALYVLNRIRWHH